ncbi:MAG TPA: hypothetical protein VIO84_02520 [Candidatus Dormibacteraeota bacterium]
MPEAAAVLKTSDAYVRRLLLRERLFGVKVGQVWAIYKEDLENFQRLRRPPGRPRKMIDPTEDGDLRRIDNERSDAHTDGFLRKPRRGGKIGSARSRRGAA